MSPLFRYFHFLRLSYYYSAFPIIAFKWFLLLNNLAFILLSFGISHLSKFWHIFYSNISFIKFLHLSYHYLACFLLSLSNGFFITTQHLFHHYLAFYTYQNFGIPLI